MKASLRFLLAGFLAIPSVSLHANEDIPLLRPGELAIVDAQQEDLIRAVTPVLSEAAQSTVRVWSGKSRLAYGTVIGDGAHVLSKWSELRGAEGQLRVESPGGELFSAAIVGVYQDDDLAVLELPGAQLTPVNWSEKTPKLGSFLAAPRPDGLLAGFGVLSVLERNLRETENAFLGVVGDTNFDGPGVMIRQILPDSGAAAADLAEGDVIRKVSGREISGLLELRNALVGREPGESVQLSIANGEGVREVDVVMGKRPEMPRFPDLRMRQMERMGGDISRVRDSFSSAIQSDMNLRPNQIGGPVVNLDGEVIGVSLARADRTRSLIMPSTRISKILKSEPQDPSEIREPDEALAEARLPRMRGRLPNDLADPRDPMRMRRHLSSVEQLLDFMFDEMRQLDSEWAAPKKQPAQ
ncbi:MAG: PDZ domain-containing protein [Luteolibacter sp.]